MFNHQCSFFSCSSPFPSPLTPPPLSLLPPSLPSPLISPLLPPLPSSPLSPLSSLLSSPPPSPSLTKDVEKRPHYAELLEHALIKKYETEAVDLGVWFQEQCRIHGNP